MVLAPDANPESISVNLVSYLHAEALARLHKVTLIGRTWHEEALRRTKSPFQAIETITVPWLDRLYGWSLRRIFKYNFRSTILTASSYPIYLAFEWCAWRRMRKQINAGAFDVVIRLSPVVSVIPSIFPFLLRRSSVPFLIGPINGGLPWPTGFSQANKQKSWFDRLRGLYRILPFAKSTYHRAAAVIAGSSQTYAEFASYRDKLFFLPENGVGPSLFSDRVCCSEDDRKLNLIFVGGLVPYKACDLALRASAKYLLEGLAHFTIAGDGPERGRLDELAKSLGIQEFVSFTGMLSHGDTMQQLRSADVMVFPSVREFGGGVVFEALAVGTVPVVVDFGGPGDIVHPAVGYKVSLTNEDDVVAQIEKILGELIRNRSLLDRLRQKGMAYASESLTWDAKAQSVTRIMNWVLGRGPKPDLPPPKFLAGDFRAS